MAQKSGVRPSWIFWLVLWISAALHWGCGLYVIPGQNQRSVRRLSRIQTFAIIHRHVPIEALRPFDLVILEADAFSDAEIHTLQLQGKVVLAYLNIGEVEGYRDFAQEVEKSWLLGPNPEWPDHHFVNPSERGWQDLLRKRRAIPLLQKVVDGFLLDSVDMASEKRFPDMREGMARLIRRIRTWAPNTFLLANNALFLLDEIAEVIDGVLMEEVFNTFDEDGNYATRPDEERFALLQKILKSREKWHLPFLLVDYCPENWEQECQNIQAICAANGLPHFCTDRYAQRIYQHFYPNTLIR